MQDFKTFLVAWKLALAKCGCMCLSAAIVTWTTSMSGVKWSGLDGTERAGVILGCVGSVLTVIIAFLDRSIARMEQEKPPVG